MFGKPIKYLILILFFSYGSLFAQGEKLFEQATHAYSQGKYKTAIGYYEQILDNGKTSVAVYFNLGNAHYKLHHVAESIFYYEKALQLNPSDKDVKYNLSLAKTRTIDAIEATPKTGISQLFHDFISILGYDGWAWVAIACSLLFSIFFLSYSFSSSSKWKKTFFAPALVCLLLGIMAFTFANLRRERVKKTQYAIIFAQEAKVKSAPNQNSELTFLLHEGTKVRVLENFENWYEIKIADGKQGWMKKSTLKKL